MATYMKGIVQIALVSLLCLSFKTSNNEVYICNNKNTSVYHVSKTCKALKKCTHEIITVTPKEATDKYGKRACKLCS